MLDKSLSFGIRNFFFTKSDKTGGTYDYYGFISKNGSTLIMRTNKDLSEATYFITAASFDTTWANKTEKDYLYVNELIDPTV